MQNAENSIIEQLKGAKASAATLKGTSAAFAAIRKSNFDVYKILINGIPFPEWIIVKGRLPLEKFQTLKPVWESPMMRDITLFPYGIINPEGFDVELRFNTNGIG
jgi:hypothetical protein